MISISLGHILHTNHCTKAVAFQWRFRMAENMECSLDNVHKLIDRWD